jgi:hypothetical protein
MQKKSRAILSIAAALAALATSVAPSAAGASTPQEADAAVTAPGAQPDPSARPNVFVPVGEDLLGLIVSTRQDGTVVAAHYSHVSHASHSSHSSHHSHYSSR